jgi:hypothetical protein
MDSRSRLLAVVMGVPLAVAAVVAVVVQAAGKEVALGVAITAIVLLVSSYLWTCRLTFRIASYRARSLGHDDERVRRQGERVRRRTPVHMAIMCGAPLVILAAHPWGRATIAVAFGVPVVCHFLFLYALIITGLVMKRRAQSSST